MEIIKIILLNDACQICAEEDGKRKNTAFADPLACR